MRGTSGPVPQCVSDGDCDDDGLHIAVYDLTSPVPHSRLLRCNDGHQFQQDRYFHCAIFLLFFFKSTPIATRHGPRTRRQALQNLYFLPQLEAPHGYDDVNGRDQG